MKKSIIAEFAILANTLIWGGTFVVIKNSLTDSSPVLFVAVRFFIAAFIMILIFKKTIFQIDSKTIYSGSILGFFLFLGYFFQTIGLQYTTATKSAFLTGTLVIFTPIIQTLYDKKAPSAGAIIGIILAALGLIFISSGGDSLLRIFFEIGDNFNIGDFFTLLSALSWSFYIIYLNIVGKKHAHMKLVFLQIFITAIAALLTAYLLSSLNIEVLRFNLTQDLILGLLYVSILATILTTILQTKYQPLVSPSKTGIIFSFEPIFAAIIAYLALGEILTLFGFIGCFLIFSGLLLSDLLDNLLYGRKNAKG